MYRGVWIVALAAVALAVPAASAAPTFVIVRDVSIGGFPRDGTVKRAIAVFGTPASREPQFARCTLTWPRFGVMMNTFHTPPRVPDPSTDPCGPNGRHVRTTVTDRRWRTSAGLKIGDTLGRMRGLYPRARKDAPGRWRLTTRMFAGLPFPGLEARIRNGRVVSLTVYGPRSPF